MATPLNRIRFSNARLEKIPAVAEGLAVIDAWHADRVAESRQYVRDLVADQTLTPPVTPAQAEAELAERLQLFEAVRDRMRSDFLGRQRAAQESNRA